MGLGVQSVSGSAACQKAVKVTAILAGEILEGFLAKGCQWWGEGGGAFYGLFCGVWL
jgi:hypothetical protein